MRPLDVVLALLLSGCTNLTETGEAVTCKVSPAIDAVCYVDRLIEGRSRFSCLDRNGVIHEMITSGGS